MGDGKTKPIEISILNRLFNPKHEVTSLNHKWCYSKKTELDLSADPYLQFFPVIWGISVEKSWEWHASKNRLRIAGV